MRNVLYISLALERFVYYQQEPQNYEASAGLECACIHNNRTMNQWNHTASDRSPRTWANYKLNSFARYGSCMHELWDKLLKSNKPWMRRKRALSTRYTWLKFLKECEFHHYFKAILERKLNITQTKTGSFKPPIESKGIYHVISFKCPAAKHYFSIRHTKLCKRYIQYSIIRHQESKNPGNFSLYYWIWFLMDTDDNIPIERYIYSSRNVD